VFLSHFTDDDGFKAIGAQPVWVFKASQPPGNHSKGAYFTTLGTGEKNLAKRLRIPKAKLEYVFCFTNGDDLKPLAGGRGAYIFYSPDDYSVEKERQIDHGPTDKVAERLP
jgi:hypothetical protein